MSMPTKCPLCDGWGSLQAGAVHPQPDLSRSGLVCHGCSGKGWITLAADNRAEREPSTADMILKSF